MSRSRCPGRRPASAAIPIPGAEMPLMNSTGSPAPDSRTRTRTGGDAMSTQRSCTSSPFAAATRPSVARNLASTPTGANPTPSAAIRRLASHVSRPRPPITDASSVVRSRRLVRDRNSVGVRLARRDRLRVGELASVPVDRRRQPDQIDGSEPAGEDASVRACAPQRGAATSSTELPLSAV